MERKKRSVTIGAIRGSPNPSMSPSTSGADVRTDRTWVILALDSSRWLGLSLRRPFRIAARLSIPWPRTADSDTAFDPLQLQEKGEGPEPANTQF